PARLPRRGDRGRPLRDVLRLLLRAPHPHLLRDADAGLRPDRLGDLLQVERGDGRRAGHARDPLPRLRLGREGGGAAALPRRVSYLGLLLLPVPPAGRRRALDAPENARLALLGP